MKKRLAGTLILAGCALLQFNDPDPWLWGSLYLVPVIWMWLPAKAQPKHRFGTRFLAPGYVFGAIYVMLFAPAQQYPSEPWFEAGGLLLVALWVWWFASRELQQTQLPL